MPTADELLGVAPTGRAETADNLLGIQPGAGGLGIGESFARGFM